MRKLLTIFLCIFYFHFFYAQSNTSDLQQLLKKIEVDIQNDSSFHIKTILADCQTATELNNGRKTQSFATILFLKGKALSKDKQYELAVSEYSQSLDIVKHLDDKNYEEILKTYNHRAMAERQLRNYQTMIDQLNEGLEFTQQKLDPDNIEIIESWLLKMRAFRRMGDYGKAIELGNKVLKLCESNPNITSTKLAIIYNNLGTAYKRNGNSLQSFENYEKAIEIHKRNNLLDEDTGSTYYNLANLYISIGAFNKALTYYDKAIEIFTKIDYDLVIPRCLVGKGIIYRNWGDYDRTLTHYQKALALMKQLKKPYPPNIATNYMNIGACYRHMKDFTKARKNINQALTIYQDFFKKPHSYIGRAKAHLAEIENKLGNYDLALKYFEEAKEMYVLTSGPNHNYIPVIIASKAGIYHKQNNLDQAYSTINQAIQEAQKNNWTHPTRILWDARKASILIDKNKEQEAFALIDSVFQKTGFDEAKISTLSNIAFYAPILNLIKTKAEVHKSLYQKNNDLNELMKSAKEHELAIKVLFELRKNFRTENSRQFALEKQFDLIAITIADLKDLFDQTSDPKYLEKAFQIAEKTKSLILMEAFEKKRATAFSNIDPTILKREQYLKANLELYEQLQYKESNKKEPNDSLIQEFNQQIFDFTNAYYAFQDTLHSHLKSFSNETNEVVDLATISQHLTAQNLATIEYFLADSNLYVFTFFKDQSYFDKIELPADFKNQLLSYCEDLASPNSNFEKSKGNLISNFLLKKSFDRLGSTDDIQKITIIPDIWLGYLPFETLPIPNIESKMIIEKYDISYAYAAHLLMAQKNNSFQNADKSIATYAPQYQSQNQYIAAALRTRSGKNLSDLPGAKREADLIAQLFGGDAFTGKEVTESQFRQSAKDYKLLHLSMHADMDDVNPMYSHFIFNSEQDSIHDGILTASELHNLQLNADLAVLSACNTGFGTIKKGEGIMSLSRAFRYAGVPSTVMSLWKVPDDATSKIMTSFYQFLKDGDSKDSALRRAKLAYLDQTITPEQKHPFYWAGFVAAGDMDKINLSSSNFWNWGMRLIFVVGFIFFVQYFRKD